jgi:hypothetical protein
MNYYVIMRSLVDISENINHQLDYWKNELTEVLNAIEAYKTVSSIQGATGEALNDYLDSVHSTIISAIGSEFSDYSSKITPYVNDYLSLEESEEGIIWSETIQNQLDIIPKEKTIIDDIASRVTDVIGSVSDIVSPSVTPYIVPIDMAYDEMTMFLTRLDEAIEEIESNHASDMEDIRSLIITLKGIIEPSKTLILDDVPVDKVGNYLRDYLKDKVTLDVYNSFSLLDSAMYINTPLLQIQVEQHYVHNCKVGWKNYLSNDEVNVSYYVDENGYTHLQTDGKGFYIEHQNRMNELLFGIELGKKWDELVFNEEELRARSNACEVIAVYNAMAYLDGGYSPVEFPDLLRDFECNGTALLGNWGVSPSAVNLYLSNHGYTTTFVSGPDLETDGKAYEKIQNQYNVYIMSSWNNDKAITRGVHTMTVTKESDGKFYVHNDYGDKLVGYNNLKSAVLSYHDGISEPISVIGVKKDE